VSLVVDGVERVPATGLSIPAGVSLELGLAVGSHTYTASTGYWQGLTRVKLYTFSNSFTQTSTTGVVSINNPFITQIMTDFSASRLWTGQYSIGFVTVTLNLRFNADGSCLYQFGTGTTTGCKYSLVDYQANAVKFAVDFGSGQTSDGVLNEQDKSFTLSKPPATTTTIKFMNTGQP
jgi:hypothetical protein